MKSRIDELIEQLEAEGAIITLTDEEILQVQADISEKMNEFKQTLSVREQQAASDIDNDVPNAQGLYVIR